MRVPDHKIADLMDAAFDRHVKACGIKSTNANKALFLAGAAIAVAAMDGSQGVTANLVAKSMAAFLRKDI